jgi:hypothetical protein
LVFLEYQVVIRVFQDQMLPIVFCDDSRRHCARFVIEPVAKEHVGTGRNGEKQTDVFIREIPRDDFDDNQ